VASIAEMISSSRADVRRSCGSEQLIASVAGSVYRRAKPKHEMPVRFSSRSIA
jgi:hypothetical protein